MDGWGMDLRYAVRGLIRRPLLGIGVVATLALGIGANVALFTVAKAVVFDDLPYQDTDRLVRVWPDALFYVNRTQNAYISESNGVFEQMAGWGRRGYVFEADGDTQEVRGGTVEWHHFDMLGVTPLLGRTFRREESIGRASNVLIISYSLWMQRYLGDPSVIGSSVIVSGEPFELIGVLGPDHQPIEEDWEAWSPVNMDPDHWHAQNAMAFNARLREGVTPGVAEEEMRRLFQQYATEQRGQPMGPDELTAITVVPLRTFLIAGADRLLIPSLLAVGLILLIACGNLSNLLLAHGRSRAPEMALRRAVGAGAGRLTRLLLTEGLLLGLAGGLVGVCFALGILEVFSSALPDVLPRSRGIAIDGTVLSFALVATLLAILLSWAAPIHQSGRVNLSQAIRRDGGRKGGGGIPFGGALLAGQVGLTVVLVGAAVLTIRSYSAVLNEDPGFDPESVVTFRSRFPSGRYSADEQFAAHERVLQQLRSTQGVISAGTISIMPMHSGGAYTSILSLDGSGSGDEAAGTSMRQVSDGYFETMGIELISGRLIDRDDRPETEAVVVINEAVADAVWPSSDPIGRLAGVGSDATPMKVVGVVSDVRQTGLAESSMPEIYLPVLQSPSTRRSYAISVTGDPRVALPVVAAAVRQVEPELGMLELSPLRDAVGGSVSRLRFFTRLLSLFALTALALGAVGVWGVTAHSFRLARRALGIRLALGATDRELARQLASRGLAPVAVGTVLGMVGFWFASRLFGSFLYNVDPRDPVTLVVVPAVLLLVGCAAVTGPALRTRKLQPAKILREE